VRLEKLSICGGFGKVSKLAMGNWNLHSQASSIDLDFLAQLAQEQGGDDDLAKAMVKSNTSIEALGHCAKHKVDLATAVCRAAWQHTRRKVPDHIELEVWVIDRQGHLIGMAN
jgi:cobalt-precorrin-5B (C1)-methyltransferase